MGYNIKMYLQQTPIPMMARSRRRSAVTRLLRLRVSIPTRGADISLLSGRGLCEQRITRPTEYGVSRVMEEPYTVGLAPLGLSSHGKKFFNTQE